jgi:hypothetical protein
MKMNMNKGELLGPDSSSPLLVGKDSHGNWVVRDQRGLCGGLFIGREAAIKYARSESRNRPDSVLAVSGILELDISAIPRGRRRAPSRQALRKRVA